MLALLTFQQKIRITYSMICNNTWEQATTLFWRSCSNMSTDERAYKVVSQDHHTNTSSNSTRRSTMASSWMLKIESAANRVRQVWQRDKLCHPKLISEVKEPRQNFKIKYDSRVRWSIANVWAKMHRERCLADEATCGMEGRKTGGWLHKKARRPDGLIAGYHLHFLKWALCTRLNEKLKWL